MASSETLLTIGALVLLSIFTLSLNSHMVQDHTAIYQSEQYIEAMGAAQRYIEEAEALKFDENKSATAIASFTSSLSFGPDSNESYGSFDDVDDFNGFTVVDSLTNSIPFTVNISVYYVDPNNSFNSTSSNTYFKEMSVTISSEAFAGAVGQSILLKKLFAYHYFFSN